MPPPYARIPALASRALPIAARLCRVLTLKGIPPAFSAPRTFATASAEESWISLTLLNGVITAFASYRLPCSAFGFPSTSAITTALRMAAASMAVGTSRSASSASRRLSSSLNRRFCAARLTPWV